MNIKDIKNLDRDVLLSLLGVESRRTTMDKVMPGVGLFSAGLLLGAGIGLMVAAKPGAQLRGDLANRLRKAAPQGFMARRGDGGATEGSPV
ncbi:MAG: hypothetical protein AB2A00_26955 [Myxococcota bacterium]